MIERNPPETADAVRLPTGAVPSLNDSDPDYCWHPGQQAGPGGFSELVDCPCGPWTQALEVSKIASLARHLSGYRPIVLQAIL